MGKLGTTLHLQIHKQLSEMIDCIPTEHGPIN
jgi:hypothetical protein